ncbi:hypothetical protein AXF42_Ash015636 [Apostasia shenzhenica]|uniref:PAR1 protein n=1 Tax=Apostasia shenzhenica TaxID=1088818 RepID=A0A2I0AKT5_9ASPA|nr:hypothetical protein AXF42_Ash015636 [Apostasia shenzhenica]
MMMILFNAGAGEVVVCGELPVELCTFAISSAGKRCSLESYRRGGERTSVYECRESEVVVDRMVDWVETDECVAACGGDRRMVGISSDALLDQQFTEKLCSPECFESCPNMVDLYYNLAAGEGVILSHLCEARRTNPVRAMAELSSSGFAAAAPADSSTPATPLPGNAAEAPVAAISDYANAANAAAPVAALIEPTSAAAPSDVSEYSADSSFDQLDADPVPVPATSPATMFDDEELDAGYY